MPPKKTAAKPQEEKKMTAQEYFTGFAEAPASAIIFVNVGGADIQMTLRDWSEEPLLKRVARLVSTYQVTKSAQRAPAGRPQEPTGNSFIVQHMSIEIKDQKTYAKLQGGKFTQHGVRIWPEPLIDAGIIQDADEFELLDPRNPPDLSGWTAVYETKPGNNGHATPTKVVQLIAP